jgi:hypothetical protein
MSDQDDTMQAVDFDEQTQGLACRRRLAGEFRTVGEPGGAAGNDETVVHRLVQPSVDEPIALIPESTVAAVDHQGRHVAGHRHERFRPRAKGMRCENHQ